jgi:hypothetical protein
MAGLSGKPRQMAAYIMSLNTKEERREALGVVPERFRSLVKTHVEISYERRKLARIRAASKRLRESGGQSGLFD